MSENKHITPVFLFLCIVEGFLGVFSILQNPSMERNAILFGYSYAKLGILSIAILGIAVFVFLFVQLFKTHNILCNLIRMIVSDMQIMRRTTALLILLIIVDAFLIVCVWFDWLSNSPYILAVSLVNLFPLMIWFIAIMVQFLGVLFLKREKNLVSILFAREVRPLFFSVIAGTLVIIQVLILLLKLPLYSEIPGWFYRYQAPADMIMARFFFLNICIMIVTFYLLWNNKHTLLAVLGMMAVFIGLQIGYKSLQHGYAEQAYSTYEKSARGVFTEHACNATEIGQIIRGYEDLYAEEFWEGTKPPGLIVFYKVITELSRNITGWTNTDQCLYRTSLMSFYLLPFLSSLTVIMLNFLEKEFHSLQGKRYAIFLFPFVPSLLTFTLFADQFLYPLIFTTFCLVYYKSFRKNSLKLMVINGIFLYFSIFISFSLLSLLGLALITFVLDYLSHPGWNRLGSNAQSSLGLVLGFIASHAFMLAIFGYNVLTRYQNAFISHRSIKEFVPGIRQVMDAIILNNMEFIQYLGIPIAFLVVLEGVRAGKNLFLGRGKYYDVFVLAFLSTYISVNLLGDTKGEVARLWIFFVPGFVLLATNQVRVIYYPRIKAGLMYIVGLQLISYIALFLFQTTW